MKKIVITLLAAVLLAAIVIAAAYRQPVCGPYDGTKARSAVCAFVEQPGLELERLP